MCSYIVTIAAAIKIERGNRTWKIDIDQSSDNLSSSSISYTYILYIPLGRSYVHPITVLLHIGEHINDMSVL